MDTVRCPSCGKQNDEGDRVCVHCGHPLDTTGESGGGPSTTASPSISGAQSHVTANAQTEPIERVPPPFNAPPPPSPTPGVLAPPYLFATPASNGLATAAMVLGILGVVLFWVPLIGFGLAILALVFGAIGVSKANMGSGGKGQAVAGMVLGAIGVLLPILVLSAFVNIGNHAINQIQPSFGP